MFIFSVAVNDIRAWNRFHEVQHQTTPIQIQKSGQGHQGISGETRSRLHSSGMMNLNGPGKEPILYIRDLDKLNLVLKVWF